MRRLAKFASTKTNPKQNKRMGKQTIDNSLERARIAIEGAMAQPELMKKLARHGYDRKAMEEGLALHNRVKLHDTAKSEGIGGQKKFTQDFARIRQDIDVAYAYHLQVARLALRDDAMLWDVLQLNGARKKTVASWLLQVQAFYNNIHQATEAMNFRGVSQEELEQVRAMVEAAATLRVQQASKKGASQSATARKTQMRKELNVWMRDFLYIARFAAKDDAQQLEALGLVVRS